MSDMAGLLVGGRELGAAPQGSEARHPILVRGSVEGGRDEVVLRQE